ncbi:MAG: triose-phosphate isomerase [Calditrichaeota bacterium]|nr:triose-phosphate isomerase [Calditrichota bacterium]
MSTRRSIIGGNWKMFKTPSEAATTAKALKVKLINVEAVDVVVCPPAIDVLPLVEILKETNVTIGGQNMHWEDEGAFTGEVSAAMLRDAGCSYVILGHSERRHVFGEQDSDINKKVKKALSAGLTPIFCVGEKLDEREHGRTREVVKKQVAAGLAGVQLSDPADLVVAYEPVWAIGTGVNATPEQAEEVHQYIRELLGEQFSRGLADGIRIQYGGSVKPANAAELLSQENIDGALVGGASLDPESFTAIIKSAEKVN